MSKKFVLSGYFGFKNFGDEAILSVLVEKLKEYNNEITVISSDPEYTIKKFQNIDSTHTFNLPKIINKIIKTDYLISGGGSLLQDTTSLKSLFYYLFIIFVALIFWKKVIIFAQGIGPINNAMGIFATKTLLKFCHYISVRDKKSYELLKSWGIESDLLCDPIFSTNITTTQKQNVVAIQLRNFKTMNKDFIDRLALQIANTFPNKKIEIFSFQNSIDLEICKQFENSIKLLNPDIKTNTYTNLTDNEIIEKLSTAEYLVAMRFHAIIIGLLTNTKTLAINYDIKVEKIAKEFNLPIIDLSKTFENQFEILQNQDLKSIELKTKEKIFNWTNFENAINN